MKLENTQRTEIQKDKNLKELLLPWWPIFAIFIVCMSLFTICMIERNDLKKRFISPVSSDVYTQEGETYIIATYFEESSTYTFLKELRKIEKKYGIPFYLVDVMEYGEDLIKAWSIEYAPTYFVMQRENKSDAKAELLYKSYGAKKNDVLRVEIEYCEKNGGIPVDHTGKMISLGNDLNVNITLDSVATEDNGNVKITFKVQNNSGDTFNFSNSFVSVTSYNKSTIGVLTEPNGGASILPGTEGNVEIYVSNVSQYKLRINLDFSSLGDTTNYSFAISKLDYTIDIDDIK